MFDCLFHEDPVVRMRAADGLEKITRQRPGLLEPYTERLLTDVAAIGQPSVQWHLALMLTETRLDDDHKSVAKRACRLLDQLLAP